MLVQKTEQEAESSKQENAKAQQVLDEIQLQLGADGGNSSEALLAQHKILMALGKEAQESNALAIMNLAEAQKMESVAALEVVGPSVFSFMLFLSHLSNLSFVIQRLANSISIHFAGVRFMCSSISGDSAAGNAQDWRYRGAACAFCHGGRAEAEARA